MGSAIRRQNSGKVWRDRVECGEGTVLKRHGERAWGEACILGFCGGPDGGCLLHIHMQNIIVQLE